MSDDLMQWLLGCLDDEEQAARASTPGPWEWTPEKDVWGQRGPALIRAGFDGEDGRDLTEVLSGWGHDAWGMDVSDADAAHIARHNPARILREIEAKRQLLIVHRRVRRFDFVRADGQSAGPLEVCHECDANTTDVDWPDSPCRTLRLLALPYADRPGYREEWRP